MPRAKQCGHRGNDPHVSLQLNAKFLKRSRVMRRMREEYMSRHNFELFVLEKASELAHSTKGTENQTALVSHLFWNYPFMVGPVAVKVDEIMNQVEKEAAKAKARDRRRITPNGLTLLKMSLVADAGDSSDPAILESSSGDGCKGDL